MRTKPILRRALSATVITAMVATLPAPAFAVGAGQRVTAQVGDLPPGTERPTNEIKLSVGEGQRINLPASVTDVWTSNPAAADVYVNNPRQLYLFGKDFGEATVYATSASGKVVYSTNVRVSQNLTSIDRMIRLAMPDADIHVQTVGQLAVINGTVASPEESADAQQLVTSLLNPGVNVSDPAAQLKIGVINRLKTATPLQVNLQVKFAEVSRDFVKNIGTNLQTRDTTGGFQFGIASGRQVGTIGSVDTSSLPMLDASSRFGFPAGTISLPFDPRLGDFVYPNTGTKFDFSKLGNSGERSAIGFAGKLLGLDILGSLDLGERLGQVTTLNTTNLSALSGETGSFLAGGEIPIPISQGLGATSVEYKQYGVSLSYTPTVLADGRISLRVRPEVSQLSAAGAVTLGNVQVPALTTRRAETTVEVGSGQSFMIAGLLSNNHQNQIDKTPGIGDIPILGSLFRSNGFQRNETELVIVITPYLVKPVNPDQIVLPTDGYKAPTDLERVFLGQMQGGKSGERRPMPTMAPQGNPEPSLGAAAPLPTGPQLPGQHDKPAASVPQPLSGDRGKNVAPGFSH